MGITQQIGASSLIRPGVIDNTAARPASPYEGQVIYQKDTDEVLAYNGTSWTRPANMPWGQVGYATKTTDQTFTTRTDMAGLSLTFTAAANRIYQTTFSGNLFVSAGADTTVFLTDGTTDYYEALGSILSTAPYQNRSFITYITGLSAGTKTLKIQAVAGSSAIMYGTGIRSSIAARLIIQDIGPA